MATRRTKRQKREKRSVASATARHREKSNQNYSDMFQLPEGIELFNVQSTGSLRLDVVPYTVGEGNPEADKGEFYWQRLFWIHRGIGVNDSWVICPARTAGKKCPICEYISRLRNDPDVEEDEYRPLDTSKRMLVNVRDLKKEPDKVKVWHVSYAYFGKALDDALNDAYEDHNDNMDNFCDPEDGYYLKCVAEKGWQGKGYSVERVGFKAREEDVDDEILDQAVCLDDVLVIKSYDELKDLLYAGESDEEDEEEEKTTTKKTKKTKKKTTKRKEEDELDEEFDEEFDEDQHIPDDDDDDDSPDDDDDDDFDDDDDDFDDDDDDDDSPDDDDDDDFDDDDDDFDDDDEDKEEVKPKTRKKKTTKKKTTKKKTTRRSRK